VSLQSNKDLVMSWFEASVTGDHDRWESLMHDDFRFWIGGKWHERAGLVGVAAKARSEWVSGQRTLTIGAVTAEDDRVLFEAQSSYPLPDGSRYTNFFLYSVQVRDGKILTFKDFADTLYNYLTLAPPGARERATARETPIDEVTRTITGPPA
jgi:ketosteroid isomerase-like protein